MTKIIFPGGGGAAGGGAASGANIGAGTQVWVSGIPMGDYLSPHTTSGATLGAATQIYVSGTAIGDYLSEHPAGTTPIDARAATGDLDPNASGTLDMGSTTLSWGSGFFNGVVLTAESDGSQWALQVDATGGLSTTAL